MRMDELKAFKSRINEEMSVDEGLFGAFKGGIGKTAEANTNASTKAAAQRQADEEKARKAEEQSQLAQIKRERDLGQAENNYNYHKNINNFYNGLKDRVGGLVNKVGKKVGDTAQSAVQDTKKDIHNAANQAQTQAHVQDNRERPAAQPPEKKSLGQRFGDGLKNLKTNYGNLKTADREESKLQQEKEDLTNKIDARDAKFKDMSKQDYATFVEPYKTSAEKAEDKNLKDVSDKIEQNQETAKAHPIINAAAKGQNKVEDIANKLKDNFKSKDPKQLKLDFKAAEKADKEQKKQAEEAAKKAREVKIDNSGQTKLDLGGLEGKTKTIDPEKKPLMDRVKDGLKNVTDKFKKPEAEEQQPEETKGPEENQVDNSDNKVEPNEPEVEQINKGEETSSEKTENEEPKAEEISDDSINNEPEQQTDDNGDISAQNQQVVNNTNPNNQQNTNNQQQNNQQANNNQQNNQQQNTNTNNQQQNNQQANNNQQNNQQANNNQQQNTNNQQQNNQQANNNQQNNQQQNTNTNNQQQNTSNQKGLADRILDMTKNAGKQVQRGVNYVGKEIPRAWGQGQTIANRALNQKYHGAFPLNNDQQNQQATQQPQQAQQTTNPYLAQAQAAMASMPMFNPYVMNPYMMPYMNMANMMGGMNMGGVNPQFNAQNVGQQPQQPANNGNGINLGQAVQTAMNNTYNNNTAQNTGNGYAPDANMAANIRAKLENGESPDNFSAEEKQAYDYYNQNGLIANGQLVSDDELTQHFNRVNINNNVANNAVNTGKKGRANSKKAQQNLKTQQNSQEPDNASNAQQANATNNVEQTPDSNVEQQPAANNTPEQPQGTTPVEGEQPNNQQPEQPAGDNKDIAADVNKTLDNQTEKTEDTNQQTQVSAQDVANNLEQSTENNVEQPEQPTEETKDISADVSAVNNVENNYNKGFVTRVRNQIKNGTDPNTLTGKAKEVYDNVISKETNEGPKVDVSAVGGKQEDTSLNNEEVARTRDNFTDALGDSNYKNEIKSELKKKGVKVTNGDIQLLRDDLLKGNDLASIRGKKRKAIIDYIAKNKGYTIPQAPKKEAKKAEQVQPVNKNNGERITKTKTQSAVEFANDENNVETLKKLGVNSDVIKSIKEGTALTKEQKAEVKKISAHLTEEKQKKSAVDYVNNKDNSKTLESLGVNSEDLNESIKNYDNLSDDKKAAVKATINTVNKQAEKESIAKAASKYMPKPETVRKFRDSIKHIEGTNNVDINKLKNSYGRLYEKVLQLTGNKTDDKSVKQALAYLENGNDHNYKIKRQDNDTVTFEQGANTFSITGKDNVNKFYDVANKIQKAAQDGNLIPDDFGDFSDSKVKVDGEKIEDLLKDIDSVIIEGKYAANLPVQANTIAKMIAIGTLKIEEDDDGKLQLVDVGSKYLPGELRNLVYNQYWNSDKGKEEEKNFDVEELRGGIAQGAGSVGSGKYKTGYGNSRAHKLPKVASNLGLQRTSMTRENVEEIFDMISEGKIDPFTLRPKDETDRKTRNFEGSKDETKDPKGNLHKSYSTYIDDLMKGGFINRRYNWKTGEDELKIDNTKDFRELLGRRYYNSEDNDNLHYTPNSGVYTPAALEFLEKEGLTPYSEAATSRLKGAFGDKEPQKVYTKAALDNMKYDWGTEPFSKTSDNYLQHADFKDGYEERDVKANDFDKKEDILAVITGKNNRRKASLDSINKAIKLFKNSSNAIKDEKTLLEAAGDVSEKEAADLKNAYIALKESKIIESEAGENNEKIKYKLGDKYKKINRLVQGKDGNIDAVYKYYRETYNPDKDKNNAKGITTSEKTGYDELRKLPKGVGLRDFNQLMSVVRKGKEIPEHLESVAEALKKENIDINKYSDGFKDSYTGKIVFKPRLDDKTVNTTDIKLSEDDKIHLSGAISKLYNGTELNKKETKALKNFKEQTKLPTDEFIASIPPSFIHKKQGEHGETFEIANYNILQDMYNNPEKYEKVEKAIEGGLYIKDYRDIGPVIDIDYWQSVKDLKDLADNTKDEKLKKALEEIYNNNINSDEYKKQFSTAITKQYKELDKEAKDYSNKVESLKKDYEIVNGKGSFDKVIGGKKESLGESLAKIILRQRVMKLL